MPQLSKLIASVLFFASIFTATINLSAANSSNTSDNKTPSSQVPETKKILKKRLTLDYTATRFETELNQYQKDAILTALKRWKGELPVDNAFTVTSIANLKTDTTDTNSKVKKLNKETPNAQVVYMWARSINPNWPAGRIPTGEESEEGDPRFIRTEFNVLLKQNKNGKYKASIERDTEVKTESLDISESAPDDKIYQDLFATNKADNAFTAITDILVEPSETKSSFSSNTSPNLTISSSSASSIQSSNSLSSNVISFTLNSSVTNSISTQPTTTISSKNIGFLQGLLSFGSVKASAGEFEYSWPWTNGDPWRAGQSWHGCIENNGTGCAIDFQPYNSSQSTNVLAPISSTITRACDNDSAQGQLTVGQMSILHIEKNSMVQGGVYLTKSSKIGNIFVPPQDTGGNSGSFYTWITDPDGRRYYKTPCGFTGGKHLHIKFSPIYQNGNTYQGSMAYVDGTPINGSQNYLSYCTSTCNPNYTSQNTPPNETVLPPQAAWNWAMDNRCSNVNVQQVVMKVRNNGACQKTAYNSGNRAITNYNGKCLDAGDVNNSSNNWLRYSPCHYGNNQQWKQEPQNQGGRIWSYQRNNSNQVLCIEYESLQDQFGLRVVPCSGSQNQKWYSDPGIAQEAVPTSPAPTSNYKVIKSYTNWNFGFNIHGGWDYDGAAIKLWTLSNPGANNELFTFESSGEIKNKMNNKCIDVGDINNSNNRWIRIQSCDQTNDQRFYQDSSFRIRSYANTNLCIDSAILNYQGSDLYMHTCHNGDNQKWQLN